MLWPRAYSRCNKIKPMENYSLQFRCYAFLRGLQTAHIHHGERCISHERTIISFLQGKGARVIFIRVSTFTCLINMSKPCQVLHATTAAYEYDWKCTLGGHACALIKRLTKFLCFSHSHRIILYFIEINNNSGIYFAI